MQRAGRRKLTHAYQDALGRAGLILALAASLTACAVSSPLSVTSTGAGFESNRRVALTAAEDPASLQARFTASVSQALSDQGLALDADAPLTADISVSQNTASSGIVRGEGSKAEDTQNAGEPEQDWLTAPREKRRFDKCEAQRLRATLVIYNRADGSLAYRGSGEATECGFGEADLAAFAQALVADALAPAGR